MKNKSIKFFNTAGPVNPEKHYSLPLSTRLDGQELRSLIEQEKYFVLHAPRQTGKTSTMLNFAKTLNAEGEYRVFCLCSSIPIPKLVQVVVNLVANLSQLVHC